jgi:hypothetical protein
MINEVSIKKSEKIKKRPAPSVYFNGPHLVFNAAARDLVLPAEFLSVEVSEGELILYPTGNDDGDAYKLTFQPDTQSRMSALQIVKRFEIQRGYHYPVRSEIRNEKKALIIDMKLGEVPK